MDKRETSQKAGEVKKVCNTTFSLSKSVFGYGKKKRKAGKKERKK